MPTSRAIYTAGYEGRTLAQFLASLEAQGVQCVADLRQAPISRKVGFARSALSQALSGRLIEYHHIRELGCPRIIRDAYKIDGDWDRYTAAFMAYLAQQDPALDQLAQLTARKSTALLCFEADFNYCHRSFVARAVAQRNQLPILHITPTGHIADLM